MLTLLCASLVKSMLNGEVGMHVERKRAMGIGLGLCFRSRNCYPTIR